MNRAIAFLAISCFVSTAAVADDVLYSYEGNVLPYDPTAGWGIANACDPPCYDSVIDGVYTLFWPELGNSFYYYYWIARPPVLPPATLWAEWSFRSNHPIPHHAIECDGFVYIQYGGMGDTIHMYGDAAVSFLGDDYVLGLALAEYHTYRFDSLDGIHYRFAVDGRVFHVGAENQPNGYHGIEFGGDGGCFDDWIPDLVNEWDFVRFGTISYGERIVASDPPPGFVDARVHPSLGRFTITFDSPNYVYIDDITVAVTPPNPSRDREGADPFSIQNSAFAVPVVVATRRLDNGPPDVVQIVLDRPIPYNATTRFTFNDGTLSQTIEYTFAPGDTNGDGRADLADFAAFQSCFGAVPLAGVCLALDADSNGALDLSDFAALQRLFAAP